MARAFLLTLLLELFVWSDCYQNVVRLIEKQYIQLMFDGRYPINLLKPIWSVIGWSDGVLFSSLGIFLQTYMFWNDVNNFEVITGYKTTFCYKVRKLQLYVL